MTRLINLIAIILALISAAVAQESRSFCPKIEVIGPAGITQKGDEMSFSAKVGMIGPRLKYQWTVNQGEIRSGQGTDSIIVVGGDANSNVIAVVAVEGVPSGCVNTASETAAIAQGLCGLPSDEWGILKPNDVRGRLDAFFAELQNNPTNVGLLLLNLTGNEPSDRTNPRIKLILNHAKFRKFDIGRLVFRIDTEISEHPRTRLSRAPPGVEMPCSTCLVIDGRDLK